MSKAQLQSTDQRDIHVIFRDGSAASCGCLRVARFESQRSVGDLSRLQSHASIARVSGVRSEYLNATERFVIDSWNAQRNLSGVSGLAVSDSSRGLKIGPVPAVSLVALWRAFGSATGIALVTTRHRCAEMLKRVCALPWTPPELALPRFYDPYYGCEMELLYGDSRNLNARIEATARALQVVFRKVPVITTGR